jgi:hypothetical protein
MLMGTRLITRNLLDKPRPYGLTWDILFVHPNAGNVDAAALLKLITLGRIERGQYVQRIPITLRVNNSRQFLELICSVIMMMVL